MTRPARLQQVGIDRLIRLEWLEYAAGLVATGLDAQTVKHRLEEYLASTFPNSSPATRGTLSKTVTVLLKTWAKAPADLREHQHHGAKLFAQTSKPEHLAIHWGMLMSIYPFWGAVATQTGRLLNLQETVSATQIQRRLREQYGERETVFRRCRYVIRAFIDWGVLEETKTKGVYTQGKRRSVEDPRLIAWLLEASLRARPNGAASIKDLLDSPSSFPFHLAHLSAEQVISLSPCLDILRHGLDNDLVMLREEGRAIGGKEV